MSGYSVDLAGRVAVVTGGARGIGLGVAEALVRADAVVAVASRCKRDLDIAGGGGDV